MDTSDETVDLLNDNIITNNFVVEQVMPGTSQMMTAEEEVERMIKDSEKAKERMFEVPGREINLDVSATPKGVCRSVSSIDEDYQMIDAHIDETFKRKILSFKYTDFSKLVQKSRTLKEEENQRLEIINKNGMSYLAPVE